MKEEVYKILDKLGIKYEVVNHPPAITTLDADKFIEGKVGIRSKTMFLSDKKREHFYLIILDEAKRLDIKGIGEAIGVKGLKFGKEEDLQAKMQLQFGVVSPFGLINNSERDIKVYIDKELSEEEIITFHPNENIATVFLTISDLFKFFDAYNIEYQTINM